MTVQEKFLALYKEYEGLVRAEGNEPKDIEDSMTGISAERLRLCRQFRNYFSHVQDPGFLEPTVKMMSFLQLQVDNWKLRGEVVKKHIKKPDVCMLEETSKVGEAHEMFAKLKREELLVRMKDGSFTQLSVYDILGAKSAAKVGLFKAKKVKPLFCSPMDDYGQLSSDRVVLCTDDGMSGGKLLGQVWFT